VHKSEHNKDYLTSASLKNSLKHLIPDYICSLTPLEDFKSLKQSIEEYRSKMEKQSSEIDFKFDEMKQQLYDELSKTVSKKSDLKFENLSQSITIEVDKMIKTIPKPTENSEFASSLKEEIDLKTREMGEEIEKLRQIVLRMEKRMNEIQNASNLVDTKHDTGSRFNSNEKFASSEKQQEKTKDIVVDDEENYETFKVSPVKVRPKFDL
jgi:hypothetical protein